MFGIGLEELVVIFLVALLVLGPERLPSLARDIGKAVRELRRASDELTDEFLRADQPRPEPPASASEPAPLPAHGSPTEPHADGSETAPAEPAPGEETTDFDRKAQEDADRARERGELPSGAAAPEPPREAERWG